MSGTVGILNVGAGDTKLSFDPKNPADRIRAARIVRDMLRRGFALLVEVEQPDGTMAYQRAHDFDEAKCEYIIADFDPVGARLADKAEAAEDEEANQAQADRPQPSRATAQSPTLRAAAKRGRRTKAVPAEATRAVAVARTAGG